MKKTFLLLLSNLLLAACSQTNTTTPLDNGSAQAGASKQQSQWRCNTDANNKWICQDTTLQPPAAPVAVVTGEAVAASNASTKQNSANAANTEKTQKTIKPDPAQSAPTTTPKTLLDNYPDSAFAVQLIAAQKKTAIDHYLKQHPQLDTPSLLRIQNNKGWHLLLLGIYPHYSEAQAAIIQISPSLETAPWIRPLAPLKKSSSQ